ncbi:MAG: DUF1211 domain-containing protein [Chloroflexi bacterium]|nr:DUF1211 domain-containing protein [Chloroflexota bacterium]
MLEPQKTHNPTGRLEAFSDGVFSIVITLLVFNIQVPRNLAEGQTLWQALLDSWPTELAFLIGFMLVGIMWVNHHNIFKLIGQTDHLLMVFNALLLLTIALVPFTTAVLAEYIRTSEALTATLVYNGLGVVVAVAFNIVWRYAAHQRRLIKAEVDQRIVDQISSNYRFGPLMYLAACALTLLSPALGIAVNIGLAIFFALPLNTELFGGD